MLNDDLYFECFLDSKHPDFVHTGQATTTEEVTTTRGPPQCSDGGYPEWIGDGICNDKNNNELCQWDGGDCCGSNVDTSMCIHCDW